ncbi:MAG: hypothetical protein L3J28_08705 [Candidatus Polarisedimenticolaceae bacterium]|nr:hypothetical protein [Candidatus Polarisedimenticolaceae bacterium]
MSRLRISTPKQNPGHQLSIGSQLEEIKAWVEQLPVFDAEKTLQMALPVLIEMNRTELDSSLRAYTLQLLSEALQHPIEVTQKKYFAKPLPLTDKPKAASGKIKQLLNEMVYGYKIVIQQFILQPKRRIPKSEIAHTIYQAIHYLGRLILDHYLCYESQTPKNWIELTELYRFASILSLEAAPVSLDKGQKSTIERAYIQVLLLVAIHPYRLIHDEALLIYRLMGDWSRHCSLDIPEKGWTATNELIVNPSDTSVVYHASADEKLEGVEGVRIINIDRLKAFMQTHCENAGTGSSTLAERQMRNMFTRLLDGWRSNNVRAAPRNRCTKKINIILGLHNSYRLFGGHPPEKIEPVDDQLRLVPMAGESEDPWAPDIVKAGDASTFKMDDPASDVWKEQDLLPTINEEVVISLPHFEVVQTDHSEGGLSICFDFSSGLQPHVGNLVCFQPVDEADEWKLGAIRWMELSQTDGLLGVKLFKYPPIPVACKALRGVGDGGGLMQCLLISPADLEHPEAMIIVPASVFDTATYLHVELPSDIQNITLTTPHDFSKSYAGFSFTVEQKLRAE